MGNENEEEYINKKNGKKSKKILKKMEKKQKNNNSNNNQKNNSNIKKLIEDYNYNDFDHEIEEFKRKLIFDSIQASQIIKIKPYFSQRWIEDIMM